MKPKYPGKKALLAALAVFIFLLFYNSHSVQVNVQDEKYLRLFLKEWHINSTPDQVHRDFNSELNFISTVQDSIISNIKHQEISHQFFGDVSYYYKNRKGFCYDRAVLLEKFLSLYHFSFRHVYILFGKERQSPSVATLFENRTGSHAGVEVKTKKGWMAIGTNQNWLGVTGSDELLTFASLRKKLKEPGFDFKKPLTIGKAFWIDQGFNYKVIYGLYSRHGDFFNRQDRINSASLFPSRHFLPDYDLRMLFYNL